MNLIIEETGESIPIPEDSYKHFNNKPDIRFPHPEDLSVQGCHLPDSGHNTFRTSTMRLEGGNVHVDHGYALRANLEFLYNIPKDTHPTLDDQLAKRMGGRKYTLKEYQMTHNSAELITINIQAYVE